MIRKILACSCFFLMVLSGAVRGRTQAKEAPQAAATAPSVASAQRIVTKDPDYLKLLTAPLRDDFLRAYSDGYRKKSAEIEAKVADLGDKALRAKTRADEWENVPKIDQDKFAYEADVALREARISFSQKHRDAWLDVGHVLYDENGKSLVVKSGPTAPIDTYFRVPMSGATLNQIYDKFRQIAGPEIDQRAHEYVSKSGVNSPCARNADWCYNIKRDEIEQALRSERMVVVAQGDLEQKKVDRYLLVDYDTEAVLFEIDPHASILNAVVWRFSIGPVPTPPMEPEPVQAPTAAPAESGLSREQPSEGPGNGNTGESVLQAPSSVENPPARVQVPANVTAASIISQTKPQYPAEARAGQIHGDVVLHAIIDKEGKISEVRVVSGDDLLAKSAIEAVRQWRYKPMLSNGEPTEVETTITVSFSLLE